MQQHDQPCLTLNSWTQKDHDIWLWKSRSWIGIIMLWIIICGLQIQAFIKEGPSTWGLNNEFYYFYLSYNRKEKKVFWRTISRYVIVIDTKYQYSCEKGVWTPRPQFNMSWNTVNWVILDVVLFWFINKSSKIKHAKIKQTPKIKTPKSAIVNSNELIHKYK